MTPILDSAGSHPLSGWTRRCVVLGCSTLLLLAGVQRLEAVQAEAAVVPATSDAPASGSVSRRETQEESRRRKADARLKSLRERHAAGTLSQTEEKQWERLEAQARSGPGRARPSGSTKSP